MNKQQVFEAVIAQLQSNLSRQKAANQRAREGATDSESRAESKWDTGGLEASYLARGYARQFEEAVQQLETLRSFPLADLSGQPIGLGALVLTKMGAFRDWLFLLPCCGGMEVRLEGTEVTIITPESPIGQSLLDKAAGGSYRTPAGGSGTVLEVI